MSSIIEIKPKFEKYEIKSIQKKGSSAKIIVTNKLKNKTNIFEIEDINSQIVVGDDIVISYIDNEVLAYKTQKMTEVKLSKLFIVEKSKILNDKINRICFKVDYKREIGIILKLKKSIDYIINIMKKKLIKKIIKFLVIPYFIFYIFIILLILISNPNNHELAKVHSGIMHTILSIILTSLCLITLSVFKISEEIDNDFYMVLKNKYIDIENEIQNEIKKMI